MTWQYGAAVYPIPTVTPATSLLASCDPALAKLLDFFSFMLTTYAGDAIVGASGGGTESPITAAVVQVAPIDPTTIAKAEQWQFPGLFGWRKSSKYNERSLNWRQDTTLLGIAYVLPPLSPSQQVRMLPLLTSVGHIISYALHQGFDPGYNAGEKVIASNSITQARLISAEFGQLAFDDAKPSYFPTWVGEVELIEQTLPNTTGLDTLVGTDVTVSQQDSDAAPPVNIVLAATDHLHTTTP